jgi:hypothetical protein
MAYTVIAAAQWPETLERERSLSWVPDFGNEAGPPTIDGTRQFRNFNGGGIWRCAFNQVQLRSKAQVLAWMALETTFRGGLTPVDVPYCGYRPAPATGDTVQVASYAGWAARAMAGRVDLINSTEIEPGHHFADYDPTVYGWRLYRIETVAAVSGSGTERDITFWPPARFAVAASTGGHLLEFTRPRCVMQLADSGSMDLELELRKRGNPNAEFIECGV